MQLAESLVLANPGIVSDIWLCFIHIYDILPLVIDIDYIPISEPITAQHRPKNFNMPPKFQPVSEDDKLKLLAAYCLTLGDVDKVAEYMEITKNALYVCDTICRCSH